MTLNTTVPSLLDESDTTISPGIMGVLHFTEADLIANRAGSLSEAQRVRLQSRVQKTLLFALLIAVLPLVFVVASLSNLTASGQLDNPSDPALLAVVIGVLVFAVIVGLLPLLIVLPRWLRSRKMLAKGAVLAVEGITDFDDLDQKRYTLIVVDDDERETRLPITGAAYAVFEEHQRYRVYYTPLRQVVAAELLDG